MLPRTHILLGALFAFFLWVVAPQINAWYLFLVFASSFLIDVDHYLCAVKRTGRWGLRDAFAYYRRMAVHEKKERAAGIRRRGDFHLFHTIEFHLLIGLLGFFFTPLFYVFLGMTFHSLLDVARFVAEDRLYRREYFFFNWVRKRVEML